MVVAGFNKTLFTNVSGQPVGHRLLTLILDESRNKLMCYIFHIELKVHCDLPNEMHLFIVSIVGISDTERINICLMNE